MHRVSNVPALTNATDSRFGTSAEPHTGRLEWGPVPAAANLDEHLVSVRAPESFEADQYRVLRHYLESSGEGRPLRMIAVSSPAAGEGKTTTAVNLAATLSQSPDVRVLLVDTDLRRPCVATLLGLNPAAAGPGLAGAMQDPRLELPAVVRATAFGLSVLPAGPAPLHAYHVLESPRLGRLLDEARASYDYVILDTPPLLLVPDCRLLVQSVDGFVIVVAAGRTPRKLLGETLAAMEPGKIVGIAFNGDQRPLSGYYKGYYAGYYHEAPRPSGARRWLSWFHRPSPRRHPWR
jgi:capsular exopolysaccharide synthesis family protein